MKHWKSKLLAIMVCVLCVGFFAAPAFAQKPDLSEFKILPILHEGRVKPLESFAIVTLKKLSGQSRLADMKAIEWLAMSLFDPPAAADIPCFMLGDDALAPMLGLSGDKVLYSLAELSAGLSRTTPQAIELAKREGENLPSAQKALLQLHINAALYTEILRSFSALLPLNLSLPARHKKQAGLEDEKLSYLLLHPLAQKLDAELKEIIRKKGMNPENYTADQLKTAEAAFRINQIREAGGGSKVFRVFPGVWDAQQTQWFSPWDLMLRGEGSPRSAALTARWAAAANAYREADPQGWQSAASALVQETFTQAGAAADRSRLEAELIYRTVKPYFWTTGLYVFAGLLAFLFLQRGQQGFYNAAIAAAIFALALHVLSVLSRIYILGRPPVGTLYESVLFVSLICGAAGLMLAFMRKSPHALMSGVFAAAGLLMVAPAALPSGDNLEVLVAVLNTNFWLATHVLCITAGYGISILAACLAHLALASKSVNSKLAQNIHFTALVALLLTAVGTVLGGIWADQSWGRFWGWDPKENGALLICLWLIWALHGRLSGKMNQAVYWVVLALLNIIVALSWFGVNLLNVGLHSYGFTSDMAWGLAVFCVLQTGLIAALWYKKIKNDKEMLSHAA